MDVGHNSPAGTNDIEDWLLLKPLAIITSPAFTGIGEKVISIDDPK